MSAKNEVKLSQVRIDGGTQPRSSIDQAIVADYAERIEAGDTFPLCDVFFDGVDYWLADGFHRYHGYAKAGRKVLPSNIHNGTQREAVLFSCGANSHHGLRRTPEDKRRAVAVLLADEEWMKRSDRWVAETCSVSAPLVADVRRQMKSTDASTNSTVNDLQLPTQAGQSGKGRGESKPSTPGAPKATNKRVGKDGKSRQTAAKPPAPEQPQESPESATEPVEPNQPEVDADSLESVQADLREYEKRLRDLARYGRKILGAEGNEVTRPWCSRYSLLTLIHPLQHVARTVLNDLPVGGNVDDPKLHREQIAENA